MLRVRKDIRLPQNGKIFFGDNGASLSFNNDQNAIQLKIDNECALNVDKTINEESNDVNDVNGINDINIQQINGNTVSTGNGIIDNGTQRVCLASNSSTIPIILSTSTNNPIFSNIVNFPSSQNVNISNISPITIQKSIDLLHTYRSQLYFDSTITGSTINHNLAYNLTNSSMNEPFNTSVTFLGGSTVYIHCIEVNLITNGKPPHNVGWGSGKTKINGFGIYYKTSANSAEYTVVNDGNDSSNALPIDPIQCNIDFFKTFRNYQLFDPASGDMGLKFYKEYNPPLQITNTGGYYFRFKKEDLTTGDLLIFNAFIDYCS